MFNFLTAFVTLVAFTTAELIDLGYDRPEVAYNTLRDLGLDECEAKSRAFVYRSGALAPKGAGPAPVPAAPVHRGGGGDRGGYGGGHRGGGYGGGGRGGFGYGGLVPIMGGPTIIAQPSFV